MFWGGILYQLLEWLCQFVLLVTANPPSLTNLLHLSSGLSVWLFYCLLSDWIKRNHEADIIWIYEITKNANTFYGFFFFLSVLFLLKNFLHVLSSLFRALFDSLACFCFVLFCLLWFILLDLVYLGIITLSNILKTKFISHFVGSYIDCFLCSTEGF